jgi:amino acid transporter
MPVGDTPYDVEREAMQLRRTMGPLDAVLFFIVASANLQWIAAAAVNGPSSLSVWLIGGAAMFVPLAVVVVSLSRRYPDEGGLYVWSKRAFGPFAGFITGWTYWASNLPYFAALLYFAAGNALFIARFRGDAPSAPPVYFVGFAFAGLLLATLLNLYGLNVGKWLSNAGGIARWSASLLLIVVAATAFRRFGSATPIALHDLRPGMQLKDLIFWSVIAFAWTGPESIAFMSGEIARPRRTIALALAIAAPVIAAIYLLGTLAVLVTAHGVDPSMGVMQAIAHGDARLGWGALTALAAFLIALSCIGGTGAWLGAVARIPFVAGIDRYLPPVFARVYPRWNSPVAALLTQTALAALFIVLSQSGTSVKGAYDVMVSSTVIVTMVPFLFLFASAVKLSGNAAVACAAIVGLCTTCVAIVFAGVPAADDPNRSLAVIKVVGSTAMILAAGTAIYGFGRRRAQNVELHHP